MSDNTYDMDVNESALMESMLRKNHASSGQLIENAKRKAEKEQSVLRKIKEKRGLASDALNEDANPPIHQFVNLVKQGPVSGEPAGLMWSPSSVETILSMYPQKSAISDVNTAISAANQQAGVPVALVGPGDERGEFFIKTDGKGNFYMAKGDKNPAAFANPAATVAAGVVPSTSSFDKAQINTSDVRHIIAGMAEQIQALRDEVRTLKEAKSTTVAEPAVDLEETEDPLAMDNLLVEKMNIKKQMEGLDDKSKSVIQKLLNAAEAIRNGQAALLDDVSTPAPAVSNSTSTMLTESAPAETKAPAVSLNSLHEMLLKTTKAIRSDKANTQLEHLADNISTLIAEGLMNNKINSLPLLQETVATFKKLVK